MRAAAKNNKLKMPWPWDIAKYCLELPYGSIRHFPAGSYDNQMMTWTGRIELNLIDTTWQAWYMFKYLNLGQWGDAERRFAMWLAEKPPEPEPTRRLDDIIAVLWGLSWWVMRLLERDGQRD